MANANKAKGTAFETAICRYLIGWGFDARRKVQRGQHDEGDIEVREIPDLVIQAKNQGQLRIADWLDSAIDQGRAAGAPLALVVAKRRGKPVADSFVVVALDTFADMMTELHEGRVAIEAAELQERLDDEEAE